MRAEMLAEGRAWIGDCFSDAPADVDDAEVERAIGRHYDGGLEGFMVDFGCPDCEGGHGDNDVCGPCWEILGVALDAADAARDGRA